MQNDPLYKYAKQIVDEKNDIPSELRDKMLNDILNGMNDHLNAEMLSRLSPTALDNFNSMLDKNPNDEELARFFKENGVDIEDATLIALSRFRRVYYGK